MPQDEQSRLAALDEYGLMDTPEEDDFDRLARLASYVFDVPIVLVSLMGEHRQFFKSHVGVDVCETSRETSFCAHTIMQDDVLVIPDAAKDPRFAANPMVMGEPYVAFYAGHPLVAPGGEKIGTLCLIDQRPRAEFTETDRQHLSDIAALVMDRMELRRVSHVRSASQARFENIAATSPDAIMCADDHGRVTFWNPAAERLFGFTEEEILFTPASVIVPPSAMPGYEAALERLRSGETSALDHHTLDSSGMRKDGTEFRAEYSFSSWFEDTTMSMGAIIRDSTQRHENAERLFHLANVDPLTDLANRTRWQSQLDAVIAAGTPATVALMDLDVFKDVNDTFGHSVGDAVLKQAAERIRTACDGAIMVARLGGDEFVALMPGDDEQTARSFGSRLVQGVSGTYEFSGQRIEMGLSVGIALHPEHAASGESLLGAADLALYRAKSLGKGQHEMFTSSLRDVAAARRAFQGELRSAFINHEFELFYQPQFSSEDRRLIGAEALLRWRHPERGLLTPAAFIDILSEKPSAPAVGEWILRTACEQAVQWREAAPELRMAVNLFDAQLKTGLLGPSVARVLEDSGLPADGLELEIVETILTRDDGHTLAILRDLREMGVGLAFDDYGTGYASLGLLKRYPVTRLKIDRTFVSHIDTDAENAAVVRAILYLADSFGMDVVAEGVERVEELEFLKDNGCRSVQGYLWGKPVPAAQFAQEFLPS